MRGLDAIERSHRKLYLSLQKELRYLESAKDHSIRAYERSFRRALPANGQATSKPALVARAKTAAVLLVGDFHPFRQSQKGFLRLVKEVRRASPRPAAIALECIRQDYQTHLDFYLQGLITAEELREEVSFEENWPFPWDSYREILEYAKAEGLPLLALNVEEKTRAGRALHLRDEAAARRIAEALTEAPKLQVFTLYGELHLAEPHLPARLRSHLKRKRVVVIHQNETQLYWSAPRLKNGQRPEVLRLRPDEFCLLNAVPWMKLRAFLDWAEGSEEEDWEDASDIDGLVSHFGSLLAEALLVANPGFDHLETWGPERLGYGPKLNGLDRTMLKHATDFQRVSFAPGAAAILVPVLSTNALTEAAALHLWARHNSTGGDGDRLTIQFLAGFLGSKLLNPKRKCNEEADLRAYLARLPRARLGRDGKARIFTRALDLLAPLLHGKKKKSAPLTGAAEIEAHRLAGYVLGNRLVLSLPQRKSAALLTQEIFTSSVSSPSWASKLLAKIGAEIRAAKLRPEGGKQEGF